MERENTRLNEIGERVQARQNHLGERVQALENRFEERVQALENRFEERVQALENRFEERVQALENRFEERVQALQNHFEERVTVLTDINHELKGELNTTRMALLFCSALLIVIIALLLGRLETKLGEVEKFKVTDVRGQLMKDMNKVKKSLTLKVQDLENSVSSLYVIN